jgi:hypothetical protein
VEEDTQMREKPFCLYATPSFLEGLSRLLDVSGGLNEYNASPSGEIADFRALLSDWQEVGIDITDALRRFAAQHGETIVHE